MENITATSHQAVPNNLIDVDVIVHAGSYSNSEPISRAPKYLPRRRTRSSDYPSEPTLVILRRLIEGDESAGNGQVNQTNPSAMRNDREEETWEVGGAYVFPETSSLFQLAWQAFGEMKSSDRSAVV